jgi:hypothetical protein
MGEYYYMELRLIRCGLIDAYIGIINNISTAASNL